MGRGEAAFVALAYALFDPATRVASANPSVSSPGGTDVLDSLCLAFGRLAPEKLEDDCTALPLTRTGLR